MKQGMRDTYTTYSVVQQCFPDCEGRAGRSWTGFLDVWPLGVSVRCDSSLRLRERRQGCFAEGSASSILQIHLRLECRFKAVSVFASCAAEQDMLQCFVADMG